MKEFLSPEEKARVIMFNSDPLLKQAVKKVMLYFIYNAETLVEGEPAGLEKNWVYGITSKEGLSFEDKGRLLQTKVDSLAFLEQAFQDIDKYKSEVEVKEGENPAL